MKELIKAEEEKTLFIGRHGNECIYVVRAVSREAAMHLLNEVTGFEGDAWDLDVADNENGKIILCQNLRLCINQQILCI